MLSMKLFLYSLFLNFFVLGVLQDTKAYNTDIRSCYLSYHIGVSVYSTYMSPFDIFLLCSDVVDI